MKAAATYSHCSCLVSDKRRHIQFTLGPEADGVHNGGRHNPQRRRVDMQHRSARAVPGWHAINCLNPSIMCSLVSLERNGFRTDWSTNQGPDRVFSIPHIQHFELGVRPFPRGLSCCRALPTGGPPRRAGIVCVAQTIARRHRRGRECSWTFRGASQTAPLPNWIMDTERKGTSEQALYTCIRC
jgi:hypothetical protein